MSIMEGFPLVIARREDHLAAARIANACARKDVPTSTVDCLIAALAITRQAALFTLDADIARMAAPSGRPGDVFDIQQQAEGRWLLVRLEKPERAARMSEAAGVKPLRKAPLRPRMPWERLRALTREP